MSSPQGQGDAKAGRLPRQSYKITFLPANVTVEVDPEQVPYGSHGRPGSVLDVALAAGVSIEHACGGFSACATCHVIVRDGTDSCGQPDEQELDRLDEAYGTTPQSRLGCQCVPDGSCDVVIEVPRWGRNVGGQVK